MGFRFGDNQLGMCKVWLHAMDIYGYDICNGLVHVVGNVDLRCKELKNIPVQVM